MSICRFSTLLTQPTESCRFNQPLLDSLSDADFESSIGRVFGLTTIQTLSLIVMVSLTAAQFFATFQLLPHAKLGFTLAILAYTGVAIA